MVILDYFCYVYIFHSHYNTDWIAKMEICLDPNDSVKKGCGISLTALLCPLIQEEHFSVLGEKDVHYVLVNCLWGVYPETVQLLLDLSC